jgi:hypothetical protein
MDSMIDYICFFVALLKNKKGKLIVLKKQFPIHEHHFSRKYINKK